MNKESNLQVFRHLFFPGKLLYIGIILILISFYGISYAFTPGHDRHDIMTYAVFITPGIFALSYGLSLLKKPIPKANNLALRMVLVMMFSALPMIVLNTIFMVVYRLLHSEAILQQSYLYEESMITSIILFLLVGLISQLTGGLLGFLIIILPIIAFLQPDSLTEESSLTTINEPEKRNKAAAILYISVSMFMVSFLMIYFSLGFSEDILLHPFTTFAQIKWIFQEITYGIYDFKSVVWVIGLFLFVLSFLAMIGVFIRSRFAGFFEKNPGQSEENPSMRKFTILIALAIIIPFIFQAITNDKTETFDQAIHFNESIDFTDHFSSSELNSEKDEILNFLSKMDFLDLQLSDYGWYRTEKRKSLYDFESDFTFYAGSLKGDADDISYDMRVTTSDISFTNLPSDYHKVTLDNNTNVHVKQQSENSLTVAFEKDDVYYSISALGHRGTKPEEDKLLDEINQMTNDNDFAKEVVEHTADNFKTYLSVPEHFPDNLRLVNLEILNDGLSYKYYKSFDTEGIRSNVDTSVRVDIQNHDFSKFDKRGKSTQIKLDDNINGDLYLAYTDNVPSSAYYHQNAIIFEDNNTFYRIYSNNLERPINTKNPDKLINITNSLIQ